MQLKIVLFPEMSFGLARTYINRIDGLILHVDKKEFMVQEPDGSLALVCEHDRVEQIIDDMQTEGFLED